MSGRFLLDTNVVIGLFSGDPSVLEQLAGAMHVAVPCIVLGELYYGARNSSRVLENTARIQELQKTVPALACDAATARHYGEIKFALKTSGTPIPENDIWIAALAQQHNLKLASRDQHFTRIPSLDVVTW